MTRLRIFLFRLRALVRSRQIDREIEDEIASHLAEATEEYLRQGLSPEDARRAARRSFGGVAQAREVHREVRSFMWLDDLRRDVREGWRTLRRTPTFTTAALLTLTLGIGAHTAIFSILRGTLLRPLDYPKPGQLMYVTTQYPLVGAAPVPMSAPEYFELREVNQNTNTSVANATVSSPAPSYIVDYYQYVMTDYFETMGIRIVRGRSFQPTNTSLRYQSFASGIWMPSLPNPFSDLASWRSCWGCSPALRCCWPPWAPMGLSPRLPRSGVVKLPSGWRLAPTVPPCLPT